MIDESSDTTMLRDAVRSIVGPYGFEYFATISRKKESPTELWKELGEAGFLGVNIPETYGGGGRGMSELAVITEEVVAAGCPLMLLALSPAVCASMITHVGSDSQKGEWLPGMANGEKIMSFAITEPDSGSNTHNIRTKAVRDGNHWIISGTKGSPRD